MSLTLAELSSALPKHHRSKVTPQFLATVNGMVTDPHEAEVFSKNMLTYADVLSSGAYKLTDYVNAVMFVSFKMIGLSNLEAYKRTFFAKYTDMVNRGYDSKTIAAHVAGYNKNKLVNAIYEQSLIPDHIMYASIRHRAIAAQAALLSSANENVAQKAADSLLMHLKAPDTSKIQIDIATKDVGIIEDLSNVLNRLSEVQRQSISSGSANAKQIAHSVLIEGESEEVTQLP